MSFIKKADAFGKLVGICAGYEGKYNPARQNLTVTNLRKLSKEADSANMAVIVARQNWTAATGKRKVMFQDLKNTIKRMRAEIQNMFSDPGTKTLLTSALNKAAASDSGANSDPPAEASVVSEPKVRRASGKDFATRLVAFESAVNALADAPDYQPSTPDLSVDALKAKVSELKSSASDIHTGFAELSEARHNRRRIFYQSGTGVLDTAKSVKNAVKAIFGSPSDELKNVRTIGFVR